MDYKGNYFIDDDQDPHQSKTGKIIKKTLKILLYSISFLIYGIVFYMIFSSCDSGIIDDMYFSDEARETARNNPGSFAVYKLQPSEFMNYDGSIELKHIYYAETANELEIGIKINLKKITKGKKENALVYVLTDSEGNCYTAVNKVTDSNRKYGFVRISFAEVDLSINQNKYYKYTTSYDYISEYEDRNIYTNNTSNESSEEEEEDAGVKYTLSIYPYEKIMEKSYAHIENGIVNIDYAEFEKNPVKEITKHIVYNNNTVISLEEYDG